MSAERDDEAAQRAVAEALYQFIAHGDQQHRDWLRAACVAFFAGQPRPPESPQPVVGSAA